MMRKRLILVALALLVCAYLGSYYRLSRRGMAEAKDYGIDGFLYVHCGDIIASAQQTPHAGMARHYALAIFYEPACWVDRLMFGTATPWISLCVGLSG